MRLIDVNTFKLKQFTEPNLPKYAILSHTWEDEEVDYQSFMRATLREIQSLDIYSKIWNCTRLAAQQGFEYLWVDTCCIDKSSSAELQEAINSMYRWYQNASICYVYLCDHDAGQLDLTHCRWVTRCWTLQELIAPSMVIFLASDWSALGSKFQNIEECAYATGISARVLKVPQSLTDVSVAAKMSWASKRYCTRVEDQAYSLMGLFGINMPMLYGEGEKAFIRLQEEIVKSTFDMSIFAWMNPSANELTYCGLLSPSPAYFERCSVIQSQELIESDYPPYSVTNRGMQLHAELVPEYGEANLYLLRLYKVTGRSLGRRSLGPGELAIRVKKLSANSNRFARLDSYKLFDWRNSPEGESAPLQIYVLQNPMVPGSHITTRANCIRLQDMKYIYHSGDNREERSCDMVHVWPPRKWLKEERSLIVERSNKGNRAAIWYTLDNRTSATYPGNNRAILVDLDAKGHHSLVCDPSRNRLSTDMEDADMDTSIKQIFDRTESGSDAHGDYQGIEEDDFFLMWTWARISTDLEHGRLILRLDVVETRICRDV